MGNIIPNLYTRTLAKNLTDQLDDLGESGKIGEETATTLRVSLSELVDYLKTDLAGLAEKQKNFVKNEGNVKDVASEEECIIMPEIDDDDDELEYYTAINTHRAAIV